MELKENGFNATQISKQDLKEIDSDYPVDMEDPQLDELDDSGDDEEEKNGGGKMNICKHFYRSRLELKRACSRHSRKIKSFALVVFACLYLSYFSYAMYLHHDDGRVSGLIFITVIISLVIFVKNVPYGGLLMKFQNHLKSHQRTVKHFRRFFAVACILTTCVTVLTEVVLVRPQNLVSLTGIAGILLIFLITSTHPHKIQWRPVVSGLILQYLFALVILKVPAVFGIFQWCGDMVSTIMSFSNEGSTFLYGHDFTYTGFAFMLVPLIAFVLCVLTVLEHLKILHAVLRVFGRFLAVCVGSSPAEALNASANIFMGPIDSLMIIRPFLDDVTPSELHCLMANGMSTVTGSMLGLYVLLGISADHLLAASVMSAPAALSLSKLAVPETQRRDWTALEDVQFTSKYKSIMDAASSGAVSALTLAASIIANVTAVVSIMKMVNYALDWCGQLVNFKGLTLQWICSYIFYPLALGLGIDVQDGQRVAELLGVKVFINEIIAYTTLGQYRKNRMKFEEYISHNFTEWSSNSETNDILLHGWNVTLQGGFLTERSEIISTYAMCGFANFICVGVVMGCYLVLVPHRKTVVFKYILRSMVVGHCASFITACIAGLLYK